MSPFPAADLHHAVASGFNTWAMNNRKIVFHDVSASCTQNASSSSPSCPQAEVVVQTYRGGAIGEAAKTALDASSIDFAPTLTSGEQLPFGLGVTRAALNVSIDSCWYLDEVTSASKPASRSRIFLLRLLTCPNLDLALLCLLLIRCAIRCASRRFATRSTV